MDNAHLQEEGKACVIKCEYRGTAQEGLGPDGAASCSGCAGEMRWTLCQVGAPSHPRSGIDWVNK